MYEVSPLKIQLNPELGVIFVQERPPIVFYNKCNYRADVSAIGHALTGATLKCAMTN